MVSDSTLLQHIIFIYHNIGIFKTGYNTQKAMIDLALNNIFVLYFRGLLGGHIMASHFQVQKIGLLWYKDELLHKAVELADRLLKAFDTNSGLPYPRVICIR